mgnify:CR=1 FL=1
MSDVFRFFEGTAPLLVSVPHDGRLIPAEQRARMMALVANHLFLFIAGKMETEQLGEFCCASKPLREKVDGEQATQ